MVAAVGCQAGVVQAGELEVAEEGATGGGAVEAAEDVE
jgi:hypothetical protein